MDVYKIKDRYIQKHQPTLYYLDGGPKRSFVFEELQPIQDLQLLDPILVLVPSVSSGLSAEVRVQHTKFDFVKCPLQILKQSVATVTDLSFHFICKLLHILEKFILSKSVLIICSLVLLHVNKSL